MGHYVEGGCGSYCVRPALICAVMLAVAPSAALAQTPAPQLDERAGAALERALPAPPDPGRAALPGRLGAPSGSGVVAMPPGARLSMDSVILEGATVFGPAQLAPIWEGDLGAEIGAEEVARIAGAVQAFYRKEGYLFTRVVAAPAERALRLIVVEAEIEAVSIEEPEGPVGPVAALLRRFAEPLVGLRNPTIADLERVVLLMNDVAGVTRATAVPRPGEGGPGALALSFNVARKPISGAIFADNRQQPAFGDGMVGVMAELGGWSAYGDSTRLTFTNSFWDRIGDLEERSILELSHSRYVSDQGTRVGVRLLASRNRPGGDLAPLNLEGQEYEFEVFVEHPVIRSRAFSLWARGGFEYFDSELKLGGGGAAVAADSVRVAYAEAEMLQRDSMGFTAATLGLRRGLGLFGASKKGDAALSRFDANPEALVAYGRVEREFTLTDRVSLHGRVAGQFAGSPLVGGEEFTLGGTTFGRGYDPSEAAGDHGIGAAFELRFRGGFDVQQVAVGGEIYGFADVGRVWNRGPGLPRRSDLASFGLGVRAIVDNRIFVEAEVAKPTEKLSRTNSDDVRFFMKAQYRF